MENQMIISNLVSRGFDFDHSSIHTRTLGIEKFRQYQDTASKYFSQNGFSQVDSFDEIINDIALTYAKAYLDQYDALLKRESAMQNLPLDVVVVNNADLIGYGEIIATDLHEQLTSILSEMGREDSIFDSELLDESYIEKLQQGFCLVAES